ncbi:MAG: hypothetical protein ACYC5Y_09975 [Symbiobacteriia bacterium]
MPVGSVCVTGFVIVTPTGLIGATTGFIYTTSGAIVPFRQVVGPTGGIIPVTSVSGQLAVLCGTPVLEGGSVILNVSQVVPLGGAGTAGLGGLGSFGGLGSLGGLSGLESVGFGGF